MGTKFRVEGIVRHWNLNGHSRRHGDVTLTWKQANELTMANRYNAQTGKGEQRAICDTHLRKLKNAMLDGDYTPAPGAIGLSASHRANLNFEKDERGVERFWLDVDSDNPMSLTDAGHRMGAAEAILKDAKVKLVNATGAEKARLEKLIEEVENLPFTFLIHLDGDTKKDFVALQAGRAVDAAHMFSLRVQQKDLNDPACKMAMDLAKELHRNGKSPFHKHIRFDSGGNATLPITTICARGASDLSTSLVGLARLGLAHGKTTAWLAGMVNTAYKVICEEAPELTDYGKLLTPMDDQGTKGSATMMVGAAIGLAYLLIRDGLEEPDEATLKNFVTAARETLNEKVVGNFSGGVKRQLMGRFVTRLATENEDLHEGVPMLLVRALSPSCFGAGALPKEAKAKPAKKEKASKKPVRSARKKSLPDVDGPLPDEKTTRIQDLLREGKDEEAYQLSEAAYEESIADDDEEEPVLTGSYEEIQG